MKRIVCLLMLMGVLTPLKANERPVSLAFDDAPVGQVLQALADWQNLNLMVAPEVQGTLSLRLTNVPWQQALQLVARMAQLSVETEDSILLVWPESRALEQQRKEALEQEHQREKAEKEQLLIFSSLRSLLS